MTAITTSPTTTPTMTAITTSPTTTPTMTAITTSPTTTPTTMPPTNATKPIIKITLTSSEKSTADAEMRIRIYLPHKGFWLVPSLINMIKHFIHILLLFL